MAKKLTIEDKLRIQFKKARGKSYADNFLLEEEVKETKTFLDEKERIIIKIVSEGGNYYLLTDKRILYSEGWSLPYNNIDRIYWMSEDPTERPKLKREYPQRVILRTHNGKKFQLDNLGSSYSPFKKSVEWILK